MKKTLLVVFSLSFLSVAGIKSDFLRLNKFIYSFEYPNYKQSHRDIFLNGSYDANIEGKFPTPSVHEYVLNQDFDRNGNGQAGIMLRQIKSSPVKRTNGSLSITANGKIHEKSSIEGDELLGTKDTSASDSTNVNGGHKLHIQFRKTIRTSRMEKLVVLGRKWKYRVIW